MGHASTWLPLIESILPIRAVSLSYRINRELLLGFYHQPALMGLIKWLLKDDPALQNRSWWIDSWESGQIFYNSAADYQFHVFSCGPQATDTLTALVERLSDPAGYGKGARGSFDDTLEFVRSSEYPFRASQSQSRIGFDLDCLQEVVAHSNSAQSINLRFVTPARILLPAGQRNNNRGNTRFLRDSTDLKADLITQRLWDTFNSIAGRRTSTPARMKCPPISEADMFWVDWEYGPKRSREPMGGILGHFELPKKLPTELLAALVLGQYTGIGQRRRFGWGRYRLESADGPALTQPRLRAEPLLRQAGHINILSEAYAHIRANGHQPSSKQARSARFAFDAEAQQHLETIGQRFNRTAGTKPIDPSPLRGAVIPNPGGNPRALAIPAFFDRVAQRAVVNIIGPALESLYDRHSYGYRPGRSRYQARDRIQHLFRQGYRWVVEADIDDFFDNINRTQLLSRLCCLFPDESLLEQINRWLAAPVIYQGVEVERPLGIPQGSPLSPLLANLLLDDFDADLRSQGLELVRFADDFVVLAKHRQQADKALTTIAHSLAQVGMALNPVKTRIVEFSRGFRFLGFTFLNDLALEASREKRATSDNIQILPLDRIAPKSWLYRWAKITGQQKEIVIGRPDRKAATSHGTEDDQVSTTPQSATDENDFGALLCITDIHARLSVHEGRLSVEKNQRRIAALAWHEIGAVIIFGRANISSPALMAAMKTQTPIHFASRFGNYLGCTLSAAAADQHRQLQQRQLLAFNSKEDNLARAKLLVSARIRHQMEVLRRRAPPDWTRRRSVMAKLLESVATAQNSQQLNGIEGQSSKRYFRTLSELLPPQFQFERRSRRPPMDPFNALLSMGYTWLYAHTESLIRSHGLSPWHGFYHLGRGRHAALASDMMEPFRHQVERSALSIIKLGQVKLQDFNHTTAGCRMERPALKLFLEHLSKRAYTPVGSYWGTEKRSMHGHISAQLKSLIRQIQHADHPFECYRIR